MKMKDTKRAILTNQPLPSEPQRRYGAVYGPNRDMTKVEEILAYVDFCRHKGRKNKAKIKKRQKKRNKDAKER